MSRPVASVSAGLAMVLTLVVCNQLRRDESGFPLSKGEMSAIPHTDPALTGVMTQFRWNAVAAPTSVIMATLGRFRANEDIGLNRASLTDVSSAAADILGFRVTFLESSTRPTLRGYPGFLCLQSWPPPDLDETFPLDGLDIALGEEFAVTAFFRISHLGEWSGEGVKVSFTTASGRTGETVSVFAHASLTIIPHEQAPRDSNYCGSSSSIYRAPRRDT